MSKKTLDHGMLLDAKRVMDNAIPDLQDLYEMVPAKLHLHLLGFIEQFKSTLAECDVSEQHDRNTMWYAVVINKSSCLKEVLYEFPCHSKENAMSLVESERYSAAIDAVQIIPT